MCSIIIHLESEHYKFNLEEVELSKTLTRIYFIIWITSSKVEEILIMRAKGAATPNGELAISAT